MRNFTYDQFLEILIIVLSTIIIAKIITYLCVIISKHLVKKTETEIDDQIIDAFRSPIFYTISLIGIYFALATFAFSPYMKAIFTSILQTILIIIWTIFLVHVVKILLLFAYEFKKIKYFTISTVPLFINMSVFVIWSCAIYFTFAVWHIDMTAWLASAGVVGIAIGFAAKDTLANLISGVFILTDTPFKIGDYIVLDTGDRGQVTHIGIRTTRIKTTDGMEVTIPNAIIGNATLKNESGGDMGKSFVITIPFSVAYGTDIKKAEEIVLDIAKNNVHILKDPAPVTRFLTFGASSLDCKLFAWIESSSKKGIAIHEINHAIYDAFMQHDIEIPYEKRDLYIKEMIKNDN